MAQKLVQRRAFKGQHERAGPVLMKIKFTPHGADRCADVGRMAVEGGCNHRRLCCAQTWCARAHDTRFLACNTGEVISQTTMELYDPRLWAMDYLLDGVEGSTI